MTDTLFTDKDISLAWDRATKSVNAAEDLKPHTKNTVSNFLQLVELRLQERAPLSTEGVLDYLSERMQKTENEPVASAEDQSKKISKMQRCCDEFAAALGIKARWEEVSRSRGAATAEVGRQ